MAERRADRTFTERAAKRGRAHDFPVTLMLATVAGAVSQIAQVVVDIGRSAGWWQ